MCSFRQSDNILVSNQGLHSLNAWYVRETAAFALSTSQQKTKDIGERLEQLLQQYDWIAHRDFRRTALLFSALQESAKNGKLDTCQVPSFVVLPHLACSALPRSWPEREGAMSGACRSEAREALGKTLSCPPTSSDHVHPHQMK